MKSAVLSYFTNHNICGSLEAFGSAHLVKNDYRHSFQGQEKDDEIKDIEGSSFNYKYRMHDPRIGRFFAVDPMSNTYPFYSPYCFSGNRIIDAIELEGLQPGVLFSSADEAAENWGDFYNGKAIKKDREYASKIYSVNVDGITYYAYNAAKKGGKHSSRPNPIIPDNATVVADIHTHGAYEAELDNSQGSEPKSLGEGYTSLDPGQDLNNSFSRSDFVGNVVEDKIDGYLVTSDGSLLLLDYEKQKSDSNGWDDRVIDVVSEDMPSDPNDPSVIKETKSKFISNAVELLKKTTSTNQ